MSIIPSPAAPATIADVLAPARLWHAWQRVARRRGAAGTDGISVSRFALDAEARLEALRREVLDGSYSPLDLRTVPIPKGDGSQRVLSIACVADRVLQRAAADALCPRIEPRLQPSTYAFRPGRSTGDALAQIARRRRAGLIWTAESDVESFFDNVLHDPLLARLRDGLVDERLAGLIASWLAQTGNGRGLAQGSPLSPLLANLFLDPLDRTFAGGEVRLVRYADDLVWQARTADVAEGALGEAREVLAGLGLDLKDAKTAIIPPRQPIAFLGQVVHRGATFRPGDGASSKNSIGEESKPLRPLSARHRVLYVNQPYRRLSACGGGFAAWDGDREVARIPAEGLHRIDIGPTNSISAAALRMAMARGIRVLLVDGQGETRGVCAPPDHRRAGLHLAQASLALDPVRRLDLARRVVAGKIANQRALLRRLGRKRGREILAPVARSLGRLIKRASQAPDIAHAMGIEGKAAADYWKAWGHRLMPGWTFAGRKKRPPPDPVNVVLSYLSTLLHRDMEAALVRHGLHTGIAVLHEARDRHPALVSDLVEEFRPALVDGLALWLMNTGALSPAMFQTRPDGGCGLCTYGRGVVIRAWERWLRRPVMSPRFGHRVSWRGLLEEQAVAWTRHVEGGEAYRPYAMDY